MASELSFEYKGILEGKYTEGILSAINRDEASFKLKSQRIIITSLILVKGQKKDTKGKKESTGFSLFGNKVKQKDVMIFVKKLSTMVKAGLPVLDSLKMVETQTDEKNLKKVVGTIAKDLESGVSLSKCFDRHSNAFDNVAINMIKAGEASGKLDLFLQKLVEILERREDIKRKIKSAMFYPVILVSVAVTISGFMLIKVVPIFEKMYGDMGVPLPGPTKAVLAASRFVSGWGGFYLVLGFVLFYITYKYLMKSSLGFRRGMHKLSLKYPIFGPLIAQSIYARIALVMSNLIAAGVSIIETLDIAMSSTDNVVVNESLEKVKRGVFSGTDLSNLFLKEPIFPPTFGQLIGVGEKTGNLEEMFISIANYYQDEFDAAVGKLATAIEPLMIVFIGALIGILLVAMYMPIFSAGSVIG